jgi:hypothetical protein
VTREASSARSALRWAVWIGLVVVAVAGVAVYAARSRPVAVPLCVAEAVPEQAKLAGDTWVWLERTGGTANVVSVRAGRRTIVAKHREIAGLSVAPYAVAWIGRDGDEWVIRKAGLDGSNLTEIGRIKETPLAVWTDRHQVAWVIERATQPTAADFIPPLGNTTEIWLAVGHTQQKIAEIAEGFVTAQLLDVRAGVFYLAGVRREGIRCTVFYALERDNPPHRFAGEIGVATAVMTPSGRIFWTAPSRGSNSLMTGCVRAADAAKRVPSVVADWFPAGGEPHETARGLVITGAGTETAWRVVADRPYGEPLPMLPDQWPVSAGGDVLLTVHRAKTPGRILVSTVRLP